MDTKLRALIQISLLGFQNKIYKTLKSGLASVTQSGVCIPKV